MEISVIICTHNPRPDYLRRVLDALKVQTLPKEQWELLLIDNASKEPLSNTWDLSWHPHARHIREDELGLTPARLCGIKESVGGLLIFVDDDNVLAEDYLEQAIRIAGDFSQIGAFGGSIKGEFETVPREWIAPYLEGLAVCELDKDHWSNKGGWSKASPYGAGMCIRQSVARDYFQKATTSPLRMTLDRSGAGMGSGGDSDMAWCAIDLGLGTGRFAALKMGHLIPQSRLNEDYITRLYAGFAAAGEVLDVLRSGRVYMKKPAWRDWARLVVEHLRTRGIERRIMVASWHARRAARRAIARAVAGPRSEVS